MFFLQRSITSLGVGSGFSLKILLIFQEPGEAAHKFLRRWQTSHARQMKIEDRNTDVMHRMIERSDPELIRHMDTHSRHFKRTNETKEKSLPIPQEARDLCKNPAALDPTATISLVEENFDSDSGTDSGSDSEMDTN